MNKWIKNIGWIFLFLLLLRKYYAGPIAKNLVLTDPGSFSMIVLPDPQSYVKFDYNQPLFELMTAWIVQQAGPLQIKAVLCTGDLVEQNDLLIPDGINGNQTSREQWEASSKAFQRLDHKVPYMVATGNHDYGYRKAENRSTHFPAYFYVERNSVWKKHLIDVCNNVEGKPTLENAAYEFQTDTWGDLLIISLEFAPCDETLYWAKELCMQEKYREHRVILLTHSYLEADGTRIREEPKYLIHPANYGEAIWEKLIYPVSNIRLLICGHRCNLGSFEENVSFREERNIAGKSISQMMFNAQTAGGGYHGNGGDGWLRILEFMPDGKTIRVKTYSPLFGISPTTQSYAWRTDPYDEFEIIIEK